MSGKKEAESITLIFSGFFFLLRLLNQPKVKRMQMVAYLETTNNNNEVPRP